MANSREIMRQLRGKTDRVVRTVALASLRSVILLTPVDTGRARGNWKVGVNEVDTSVDYEGGPKGARAANEAAATANALNAGAGKIGQAGAGKVITLANGLPYAPALEFGHSQQASGMVRKTAARVPEFVRAAVANERGR